MDRDGRGAARRLGRETRKSGNRVLTVAGVVVAATLAMLLVASGSPADAGAIQFNSSDFIEAHPHAWFGFGGLGMNGSLGDSLGFASTTDGDYTLGAGYQHYYSSTFLGLSFGTELGLSGRFGTGASGEVWAGGVVRQAGVTFANALTVSGAFTYGLSLVTGPDHAEAGREKARDGDATFLLYLRPEVDFSTPALPGSEVFWAVQHRSGANGTFGKLLEGSNYEVVGFRRRF